MSLSRGQGVFGIAIGPVQRELEGEIHELFPSADDGESGSKTVGTSAEAQAN